MSNVIEIGKCWTTIFFVEIVLAAVDCFQQTKIEKVFIRGLGPLIPKFDLLLLYFSGSSKLFVVAHNVWYSIVKLNLDCPIAIAD